MIIGIAGKMGVGKTTLGRMLALQLDGEIAPFAGPLKSFARLLGWNGKKDEKGRRLLQLLGTECGRECIDENIWVRHWREEIINIKRDIIVDDIRFPNEVQAIKDLGGKVIFLIGEGYEATPTHASEQDLDSVFFDYIIHNVPKTEDHLFAEMMKVIADV